MTTIAALSQVLAAVQAAAPAAAPAAVAIRDLLHNYQLPYCRFQPRQRMLGLQVRSRRGIYRGSAPNPGAPQALSDFAAQSHGPGRSADADFYGQGSSAAICRQAAVLSSPSAPLVPPQGPAAPSLAAPPALREGTEKG